MGNDHSEPGQSFRREDWEEVERSEQAITWQNRRDPSQRIEEHRLHLASQEECTRERQVYYLRKNHPQLVAALYLSAEEGSDFCASSYQQRLFLEKTPIRLADIEHIPYPDFLHLYSQALRGFAELAQHFGGFAVQEQHIGVNEKGVAKVWINPDFASNHPIGSKVSQEDMVRSIVEIIQRNIDQSQLPQRVPPLRDYLYRNAPKLNFQQAITQFNNFTQEFANGYIPQKLQCIDRVGGIYAIANREKFMTVLRPQSIDNWEKGQSFPIASFQPTYSGGRPVILQNGINRPQVTTVFYPSPAFPPIPTMGNSLLTPSTVRENVPVVRKPAATFYNFTNQPIIQQPLPEPPAIKVGARPIEPKTGQSSVPPQTLNGWGTSSVSNDPSNIANRLLGEINNQGRPVIQAPSQPTYFTPQFFQFTPPPIQQPTNSFTYVPSPPINMNSSRQVSQVGYTPTQSNIGLNYVPAESNVALGALAAIQSEAPTISLPAENLPIISIPENSSNFNFNFARPEQAIIQAPPEPSLPDFTASKPSQWKGVEVDDGKSSLDFFKKLNELSTFGTSFQPLPQQPSQQQYSNPFRGGESDFGRNAVSKIVGPSEGERVSEPLRFENSSIQMKYSIFQESPQRPSYSYNANYDPQILQDLQRQNK